MSERIELSGRCHCGEISINARIDASMVVACHCTDCRVFSGGPFRAIAIADAKDFEMKGAPSEYVKVADSGNKRVQAFCGKCGSHLFSTDEQRSKFSIRTGFLDQHERLVPRKHIFGKSTPDWLHEMKDQAWVVGEPNSDPYQPGGK